MSETSLSKLRKTWLEQGKRPLTRTNFDKPLRPANTGFIYAIRSPSGKWYIGQTRQELHERWKQHNHPSRIEGGCRLISRAFVKYGVDNMEMWILESKVPFDDLNHRERILIAMHRTFDPNGMGYNLTPGGEQSPMHDTEVAARSSATHKRQWQDPDHREKMSEAKRNSLACAQLYKRMRESKPEIDYWAMTRAEALKRLKMNRWQHVWRAERKGNPSDTTEYDIQIAEHERRHEERYYQMPPSKALRLLRASKSVMKRHYERKGIPFERAWWYDDQIRAHAQRGKERTS